LTDKVEPKCKFSIYSERKDLKIKKALAIIKYDESFVRKI